MNRDRQFDLAFSFPSGRYGDERDAFLFLLGEQKEHVEGRSVVERLSARIHHVHGKSEALLAKWVY